MSRKIDKILLVKKIYEMVVNDFKPNTEFEKLIFNNKTLIFKALESFDCEISFEAKGDIVIINVKNKNYNNSYSITCSFEDNKYKITSDFVGVETDSSDEFLKILSATVEFLNDIDVIKNAVEQSEDKGVKDNLKSGFDNLSKQFSNEEGEESGIGNENEIEMNVDSNEEKKEGFKYKINDYYVFYEAYDRKHLRKVYGFYMKEANGDYKLVFAKNNISGKIFERIDENTVNDFIKYLGEDVRGIKNVNDKKDKSVIDKVKEDTKEDFNIFDVDDEDFSTNDSDIYNNTDDEMSTETGIEFIESDNKTITLRVNGVKTKYELAEGVGEEEFNDIVNSLQDNSVSDDEKYDIIGSKLRIVEIYQDEDDFDLNIDSDDEDFSGEEDEVDTDNDLSGLIDKSDENVVSINIKIPVSALQVLESVYTYKDYLIISKMTNDSMAFKKMLEYLERDKYKVYREFLNIEDKLLKENRELIITTDIYKDFDGYKLYKLNEKYVIAFGEKSTYILSLYESSKNKNRFIKESKNEDDRYGRKKNIKRDLEKLFYTYIKK